MYKATELGSHDPSGLVGLIFSILFSSKLDPFVRVHFANKTQESSTVYESSSPLWKQFLVFSNVQINTLTSEEITLNDLIAVIEVYDRDDDVLTFIFISFLIIY